MLSVPEVATQSAHQGDTATSDPWVDRLAQYPASTRTEAHRQDGKQLPAGSKHKP
jgi:hypothetical protein